ncbi:pyridoxamine 5'-phosphate oxidase [Oxobacter pfennigii]|uniref:Pyridoxamine 5'-phosphate oxidase n=1 Tax=Oxobacter pfennigii TaxID=36849 RepID=A0A0P8YDN1_9CLOT|nr:pyridoxamine 5'-phosphate oxidase family protein [Oxobacter pfennigii]KPU45355.1 pyridoxamine 5'-phosphate oxidase [Oxobacter pfennigii]
MIISEDVKKVLEGSAFLSIVTVDSNGTPHPIIVGKGEVSDDKVVFGIYKMEETRKNLETNSSAWVVGATKDGGPKGYRLAGTATTQDKQLIFTAASVEALI